MRLFFGAIFWEALRSGPANTWAASLQPVKSVALPEGKLPLRDVTFLSDSIVVAAGYDCTPVLFEAKIDNGTVQSWSYKAELGGVGRPVNNANDGGRRASQFTSGLAMFKAQTDLGLDGASSGATDDASRAQSLHNNCVQCIRKAVVRSPSPNAGSTFFTTSALDGVLALWGV